MRNFIYEGDHLPFTAAAAVASGDGVVMGTVLGVAAADIAVGDTGTIAVEGVFELPKLSTDAISAGDALTWDVTNNELKVAAAGTGDLLACAFATEAAGAGTPTVRAKLIPGNATISP